MTPAFSARRRADEFEALVSRSDPSPLSEQDARSFAALLAVVDDLRAFPEVTARPEFVGNLREQLMAAADTLLVPAGDAARPSAPTHEPLRAPRRRRRLSVLLGSAALVGATASVAVAAQSAIPGDSLYQVKRGIESAQLQLVTGADRGRSQLANAADRLTELEALSARDDDARTTALATDTLHAFTEQADEGGELLLQAYGETQDRSLVEQVHEFNVTSMSRLIELEDSLPPDLADGLGAAASTLVELDSMATKTCAACSGGLTNLPAPRALDIDLGSAPTTRTGVTGTATTGQEVDGIVVPDLDVPGLEAPDGAQTPALPASPSPTTKTPGETLTKTTGKVKETVKGTDDTVKGTTDTLGEVTGDVTGGATDGLTDGVTGTVGGVTDGTLDDVTEWLGYLNGGVTGATGSGGTAPTLPGSEDSSDLLP